MLTTCQLKCLYVVSLAVSLLTTAVICGEEYHGYLTHMYDVQFICDHSDIYLSMFDVHCFQVINTRLPHPLPSRTFLLRIQQHMNKLVNKK